MGGSIGSLLFLIGSPAYHFVLVNRYGADGDFPFKASLIG
jgi:hypothetical protein